MEPVKLKDVQGPPTAFMLEERFGNMKKLYTSHGPNQSYATLVSSLLKQNIACLAELVLLDVRARTKAVVQWLSGESVQPVTTAPLLPPFKTWPVVAWIYKRRQKPLNAHPNYCPTNHAETMYSQKVQTEDRIKQLGAQLEEARLVTSQLVRLMDESKTVTKPPLPAYENNHGSLAKTGQVAPIDWGSSV